MKVREWIKSRPGHPVLIDAEADLRRIAERLLAVRGLRDLYVEDESSRIIGHLPFRRIAQLVLAAHQPTRSRRQIAHHVAPGPARELMSGHYPAAHPDEELDTVLARMLEHDVEEMPAVDEQHRPLGVLNLTDLLRHYTAQPPLNGNTEPPDPE